MNKKAEIFKKYLADKKITCFKEEPLKEDELNTVVYRSFIEVEGQQLPTLVILDSSIYCMVRVKLANAALKADKETALFKHINAINSKYKIFKYYFAADGSLLLDSYVLNKSGEVDCAMIFTVLDVIIKHLTEEYKNIMKEIWG